MITLRTFRAFVAVAECGTYTAAGKKIGLTSAAVGQQIKTMEETLKTPLFHKNGHQLVLNHFGENLLKETQELLVKYEEILKSGDGKQGKLTGTVHIGALVSSLMGAFSDVLWLIRRNNPDLDVKVFAGQSGDFAHKITSGQLDAAIATEPPEYAYNELIWTPLYAESMILIIPRKPFFTLEEQTPEPSLEILKHAPFIHFDQMTWTGILIRNTLKKLAVTVDIQMEINSIEAIIELVRQGYGVSILPKLANLDWEKDEKLLYVDLSHTKIYRRIGILERKYHPRSGFTKAIRDHFSEKI
ncbi:MAG: LysR family transcriptional regulator [Alcaligenaceae bacterium]|nr:LysR family transcriptional regulator [Alcaligenaceae bacterium]